MAGDWPCFLFSSLKTRQFKFSEKWIYFIKINKSGKNFIHHRSSQSGIILILLDLRRCWCHDQAVFEVAVQISVSGWLLTMVPLPLCQPFANTLCEGHELAASLDLVDLEPADVEELPPWRWLLPSPYHPAMLPTPKWLRDNRLRFLLLSPGCWLLTPPCHPATLTTPRWLRDNRLRLLL